MKKLPLAISVLLLALGVVLLVNVWRFDSKQPQVEPAPAVQVDNAALAERLAGSIRFQTITEDTNNVRADQFQALHGYLSSAFPAFHRVAARETISEYSLLYTWKGHDESLAPILLTAHQDVVPVDPGTEQRWEQPPFAGVIAGGHVWGRGALDDKFGLMGLLEAAELLATEGFKPARTVHFAFGHDEERDGEQGAAGIARVLRERKVRPEYVLDEASVIVVGTFPLPQPVALVGVAHKGQVIVELTVHAAGGHSAMPPRETAVGILSRAIHRLESHPLPGRLAGVGAQTFEYVGPEMSPPNKVLFANLWLFRPLIERKLSASPATDWALRTTTAATVIEGGVKSNVLPVKARAIVDFRVLPGDTIDAVLAHVRDRVNDGRVRIGTLRRVEPSRISGTESLGFTTIQKTVRQVFADAVVAPGLVIGPPDARHYADLTEHVYRFTPQVFRKGDAERVHGINERVAVDDYARGVKFYVQLLRNSGL